MIEVTDFKNDFELAQILQNLLIEHATGGQGSNSEYLSIRNHFINNQQTKILLPDFIRTSRSLAQFWQFIKAKISTYSERRQFIYSAFTPLLDHLESVSNTPSDIVISAELKTFDEQSVHAVWERALERRNNDPDGAITIARTLLETVCKHILDTENIEYDSKKIELPDLYKLTSTHLNISPSQHTEEIFKQILGNCSGVVSGLGQLRNALSDAHGKGKKYIRPAPRHAELAVNLAGTISLFLIRTYSK